MNRRRTTLDSPATKHPTHRRATVRLTFDPDGCTHLSAHGLHHDTARAAEAILDTFRKADARDDAEAATRVARRHRRRALLARLGRGPLTLVPMQTATPPPHNARSPVNNKLRSVTDRDDATACPRRRRTTGDR